MRTVYGKVAYACVDALKGYLEEGPIAVHSPAGYCAVEIAVSGLDQRSVSKAVKSRVPKVIKNGENAGLVKPINHSEAVCATGICSAVEVAVIGQNQSSNRIVGSNTVKIVRGDGQAI